MNWLWIVYQKYMCLRYPFIHSCKYFFPEENQQKLGEGGNVTDWRIAIVKCQKNIVYKKKCDFIKCRSVQKNFLRIIAAMGPSILIDDDLPPFLTLDPCLCIAIHPSFLLRNRVPAHIAFDPRSIPGSIAIDGPTSLLCPGRVCPTPPSPILPFPRSCSRPSLLLCLLSANTHRVRSRPRHQTMFRSRMQSRQWREEDEHSCFGWFWRMWRIIVLIGFGCCCWEFEMCRWMLGSGLGILCGLKIRQKWGQKHTLPQMRMPQGNKMLCLLHVCDAHFRFRPIYAI